MNYFEHHIGDYDEATSHLTACEDGIYSRLIRKYMASEKPLIADVPSLQRLIRARTREEKKAVEDVLHEFFFLAEDGWHQKRCDQEIIRFQDKQNKARRSAEARWAPHREQSERNANAFPDAMRTHSEGNALQTPNTSLQAPDIDTYTSPAKLPTCTHLDLIDLYGKHLPELPQPRRELWTGKNADAMRARWRWVLTAVKEDGERYATTTQEGVAFFDLFFGHVANSEFLSGRNGKWSGCDLGWLMKADNFAKVVQGNYDNKTETGLARREHA